MSGDQCTDGPVDVEALRAAFAEAKRMLQQERERADHSARLATEAFDQARAAQREADRLRETVARLEAELAAAKRQAADWWSAKEAADREREVVAGQKARLRRELDRARQDLEMLAPIAAAASSIVDAWTSQKPFADDDGVRLIAAVTAYREANDDQS